MERAKGKLYFHYIEKPLFKPRWHYFLFHIQSIDNQECEYGCIQNLMHIFVIPHFSAKRIDMIFDLIAHTRHQWILECMEYQHIDSTSQKQRIINKFYNNDILVNTTYYLGVNCFEQDTPAPKTTWQREALPHLLCVTWPGIFIV